MENSPDNSGSTLTAHFNQEHRELLYKVLVVGDVSTGKTSIIKRYVHNIYSIAYKATIGVDFALKVIRWDDNTSVRLQLWDMAGQERFANMTRVYYKEAVAAFVVFDVSRCNTLDGAIKWKSDIDAKITLPETDKPIPVVLLANKIDLIEDPDNDEKQKQRKEMLNTFCKTHGFIAWFETSAKDNVGIETASNTLVRAILDNLINQSDDQNESMLNGRETIALVNNKISNYETCC